MDESWQPGQEVWLAGDPPVTGTVTHVERADGEVIYRVFLKTGEHRYVAAKDVRARPGAGELRMIGRDELLRRLLLYKLRRPLSDVLYTYRASRTAFEVYQFKPIFKFLKTDRRSLLIADEVGLGKTIEACLIYLELKARADLERVLVLCPSALRDKWRSELKLRFDEDFTILDRTVLSTWLRDYQRTNGHQRLRGIASLELIRRTELQERFSEAALALDLLIIDEAHHARNAATETHRAARLLADQSENVLLLTATPLQTRSEDLYNILQLVDPGTFSDSATFPEQLRPNAYVNRAIRALGHLPPDRAAALGELRALDAFAETRDHPILRRVRTRLADPSALAATETAALRYDLLELNSLAYVFTRTRKRDVAATAQRRARTVRVPLSPAEREFYEALLDFVRARVQAETGALAPFVVVAQERQAASCLVATRRYLEHVLRARVRQLQLEDGGTELEDDRSGNVVPAELVQIRELLDLSATIGEVDTKFDELVDLLRLLLAESVGNKVLVFSFFRRTIEYLRERLARLGYVVYVVHGGIDVDQRPSIIARFEAEERPSVLLSTEVGAEGLDFQFCDTLVNYDLPWNPMKVEQRIGRIDRYGQQRPTIHIVNFVLADTIEDRILERLYDRIEIFQNSIGDLEPILGDEIQRLTAALFRRRLTPEEEERLAEETALRIANLRIEQERFEQQRAELMAHDSLFLSEVSDAVSSGRFVSAAEIAATVQGWLRAAFPDSEFVQADRSTWLLRADARLQAHFQEVVASVRDNNSTGIGFLQRLTTGRAGVPCTFDDEAALRNRNLEFLNLRHPFVRAAIAFFERRSQAELASAEITVARVSADGPPDLAGQYTFFLNAVHIEGITSQMTFVPLAYDSARRLRPDVAARLLHLLQGSKGDASAGIDEAELELQGRIQHEAMIRERARLEAEARERNVAILEARVANVRRTFEHKIRRREQWRDEAADQRIRRMREAEIQNLRAQLAARLEELEHKRDVRVTYELVERGILEVVASKEQPRPAREEPPIYAPAAAGDEAGPPAPPSPAQPTPAAKPRPSPRPTPTAVAKAGPIDTQTAKAKTPAMPALPAIPPVTPNPRAEPEAEPTSSAGAGGGIVAFVSWLRRILGR